MSPLSPSNPSKNWDTFKPPSPHRAEMGGVHYESSMDQLELEKWVILLRWLYGNLYFWQKNSTVIKEDFFEQQK